MAEVTPTGPQGLAKVALRDMVAASATFQTAIGATGDAAAKIAAAKLRLHMTVADPTAARPFGVICNTENARQSRTSNTSFAPSGDLELRFEQAVAEAYLTDTNELDPDEEANAELAFQNFYENVIADMKTLSCQAGYLIISAIEEIEGPVFFEMKLSETKTWIAGIRLLVAWGIE